MRSAYSDCKAICGVTVENAVPDNNFHVKEKLSLLENEHLEHKSTANDPNVAIVDTDINHTINDAVEQRGNVKVDTNDYDYTTTKVVKTERDQDKVYNKLKFERHCDYTHVKSHCQVHDLPKINPYDTASVSYKANATLASVNDDYDHVEGKGRIHIAATINGCFMTSSAMTVRAGSASVKDDEGEYNHFSNQPGPTHKESEDVTA
ncbi:hypothetical protein DPMN_077231 [Dreissena polymorpha]|uniref:Uncharacterized protein n=1 Tax=Dreissena polymorpha TaxID=45954 RepID=A0A9D3YPK8_DREPO|nr:hypothetical protein DPMN_077229 [Dreissena polymorpha]KAH3702223.1 hypothetical protein DPMN_077231 [Dreissena polymorpha]